MIDKTSDIVLIHAYLSDEERKSVCHKFIKQFKSFGYDVIITSHLPLDKDTQELVDYAIYDKDNTLIDDPALKGYLIHYAYAPDDEGNPVPLFNIASREFFKNNTIFAVLRLLLAGVTYAKLLNKKVIHLFDYDGFLPFDDELIENSDIILNQEKQAVFYERETEHLDIEHWGERRIRHWQIMTLIMSCNVDFLYRRLRMYPNQHLKRMITQFGMQMGEELLGYVLGISYLNKGENTFEENIEIKNLEEISKKIGFEKQQVYTDAEFPWICLAKDPAQDGYRFFAMAPKGTIHVKLFYNNELYSAFSCSDWGYRTDYFAELGLNNITIHVNDEFFREYDFTDPGTKTKILMHSIWTDAPQQ
ncbi:MAG: hypothetical protein CMD65_02770 [Gammaproteobacteria bacterium]|nr:hypothetical protein [Gammaproteobacteria bacterium]